LTRGPRIESTAGSATRETSTATIDAAAPPIPIEYRNGWGNTISARSAMATVIALNMIVRPAVKIVRRSASSVLPAKPCSSSPVAP